MDEDLDSIEAKYDQTTIRVDLAGHETSSLKVRIVFTLLS